MTVRRFIAVIIAALLLNACGEAADDSPEPSKTEDSQVAAQRSPVTGLAMKDGLPKHPVYLVKIENTYNGEPQYGLSEADLVVEQLVEGGMTRLAAMYYSKLPTKLGHVRSIRGTDVGIAAPIDARIVATGAAPHVYTQVKKAGLKAYTQDRGDPGFSSDPAKQRPYNRLLNLKALSNKTADGSDSAVSAAKDNYLPWDTGAGAGPNIGNRTATSAKVRFSTQTHTNWAFKNDKWQRANGHAAPGQDFNADTLIIVQAPVGDAGYTDPAGNPVPETKFAGSGDVTILQGENVIEGTWHKDKLASAITFKDADGHRATIGPGRVWIELVPQGAGSVALK